MKKDEALNINSKQKDPNDKYNKYKVDDSDSNISEEDIETKMNRLIQIKKANKEKKEIKTLDFDKLKKDADKFKKKQKENKDKKNEENKNRIENGLKDFEKKYNKILKKQFLKKLNKKINGIENIKKGFEKTEILSKKLKKKRKEKIFKDLKTFWRNKREEERKKREEEERKKKEEERKKKELEERKRKEEEKKKREEEKRKRDEERRKRDEERKKREEEEKKRKEEEERIKKEFEERKKKEEEEKKRKEEEEKIKKENEKKNTFEKEEEKKIERQSNKKKSSLKVKIGIHDFLEEDKNSKSQSKKKITKLNLLDFDKEEEKNLKNESEPENKKKEEKSLLGNIENKKKKLEQRKKRQIQYLKLLEEQTKVREQSIKNIDEQIDEQTQKEKKIKEGLDVSKTDSLAPSDLENDEQLKKSLKQLGFIFEEKNKQNFNRKQYTRKATRILDSLSTNHLKENEALFDLNEDMKKKRIFDKKKTVKTINIPNRFNKDFDIRNKDDNIDNLSELSDTQKKKYLKKLSQRQVTIKQVRKRTIREEMFNGPINIEEKKEEEEDEQISGYEYDVDLDEHYLIESDDDTVDEEDIQADKSQLMEYDKFYKEQFFKNDVFNFEYENIHDKEEEEIKKDVERMEIKKKLKEKKKLKDVNALKGLDTDDLQKEINELKLKYDKMKKVENEKVEMIMNNTEKLLYKGRLLNNYFMDKKNERGVPHFSLENEADLGAKEVIDFKPLRKEEQARRYFDRWCCLKCRKKFNKRLVYARFWCLFLVDNQLFDNFSLLIIILNTIFILISDPRDEHNIANTSDQFFLYWYTFECILKIIAYGFVMTENAYLKDYWNCLDFFVVFVGWISWILERVMNGKKISGLAGLRAFRILRPLKTVKSVKGLRKLVIALLASISHLAETTIVLFFFFIIFAIAGVQMWQGLFLRRCMSLNYGYLISLKEKKTMCTFDSDCNLFNTNGNKYICVKAYRNPNNGVINFDNVLYGFVTVFVMVTMEGWSDIFTYVSRTFKDKIQVNPIIIFAYFIFYEMIGGFYLINLFLAVTNSEFEKIEVTRKELTGKKSFFALIKSRYDLREKEKQEKKKKERALKNKNLKKSGESLRELYFKVDDEAFHITKNRRDIPIVYQTVKDMYIMTNNNPEELYIIEEMIDDEETHLCKDIKRQQKEIDRLIDEKKKEEKKSSSRNIKEKKKDKRRGSHRVSVRISSVNLQDLNIELKKENEENNKIKRKVSKEEIPKPEEKIYTDAIEISINNTQKHLKDEMINLQKITGQNVIETKDNNLKQKIEKKEMERLIQNQLIIKPDLSFEAEIKEQKKIDKNKELEGRRKSSIIGKNPMSNKKKSKQRISNLVSRDMLKQIYQTKKYKNHINQELSFMTDLSLSNLDNSIDDKNNDSVLIDDSISDDKKSVYSKRKTIHSFSSDEQSIILDKKLSLNDEEKIYNDITFVRPNAGLPNLLKLKNDKILQERLQKLRDKFNINEFLQKEALNGLPISTLGRRRSYLNFLQYDQDRHYLEEIENPLNDLDSKNKLDISLYNKEDISLSQISLDEEQLLPKNIPQTYKIYSDNVNMEEINKKLESNKYITIARKSIMDRGAKNDNVNLTTKEMQKFYKNLNYNLNKNIIIDLKPPRGRDDKAVNRSHIFMNIEHEEEDEKEINKEKEKDKLKLKGLNESQNSHNKSMNNSVNMSSINVSNINNSKEKAIDKKIPTYIFKTPSIENNLNKFPMLNSKELIVEDQNKKYTDPLTIQQDMIPQNLRGKKFYMNYMNNIIDKDLKVKDTFKVDHWRGEVLGRQIKYIHKKQLPESTEAFFFFNDKKLNLKKYKYEKLKHFDYLDSECAYLTHSLKNLPIQILEIMPPRMRDYGRYAVGKEISLGTLSSKGASTKVSSTSTVFGNKQTHASRSKSTLILGSAFINHHKIQDEIKYKKGFYDKIYKKLDDFNYRTLSYYFNEDETLYFKLTDDKRREEKEKEKENNKNKDSKIEVKGEVKQIAIYDLKTNSHRYVQWSGGDVLYNENPDENREEWNKMIENLENFNIIIWNANPGIQRGQKIRYAFYLVATNNYFDYTILLVVIINAVFMALDGNLFTPEQFIKLSISNYVFNGIFIAEFILKFIGLGPIVYFSDAFTYLDVLIIAFAIVDMATPTSSSDNEIGAKKSAIANLSFLRVFRIFRVLRLTKVLRRMKSMRLIIISIKKALANVAYIICILLMFILIFELLGMSLLNGDSRFQSFLVAFYTTFQILTVENWNVLLYDLFRMNPLTFFYLMAWIFLGNYIIFNLFTSILLQSFSDDNSNDEDDEEEDEKIEKMYALPDYLNQIKQKEKEHKNRLKGVKTRGVANQINLQDISYSASQSRISTHSVINNVSALSGSELSSSMSQMAISYDDEETNISKDDDTKIYTGVDKSIREWQKVNKLFRRNECENALYFIPQTNKFRIFCMQLIGYKFFDNFILIMILLSTARLILDTFVNGYIWVLVFDICDLFFNLIFLFECIAKIIALGFVMDEGSYIRDNWNKIDLIIVGFSLLDFYSLYQKYLTESQGRSSLQFLKVLRLLRILRPLRFISHNGQLKLIISSLFDSILPICNALFIVLVVFFMFSIVGISLFYSLYHNCFNYNSEGTLFKVADNDFSNESIENKVNKTMPGFVNFCADRYNGIMDTGPAFKFSNILISLVTAYVLSNTEGWPDIMNSYRVFNDFYGIYFIVYLLVVSYFFLNLFTGIMFKYFNDAWSREQKVADGDKKAAKYYDFLTQIESSQPDYITYIKPPQGTLRYKLRNFVDATYFDNFIMAIIFLNMISMAMNYDDNDSTYDYGLKFANWIFTGIFVSECILKISAYGLGYFYYGWNKFDFFVVVASIADIIIANIDGIDAAFLKSFQIIRVLRVLRVTRVLRLVKALKGLEKLIQTLSWSISALANVFILMFLMFCIFSILGCYLYEGLTYKKYIDSLVYMDKYFNLNNFYNGFLLVFKSATGEDWPNIMYELAFIDEDKFNEPTAYVYMLIMNFVSAVIMLNLFLMVTLQQYDDFTTKSYNPIEKFEAFSEEFKSAWNKNSTEKDKGFRIKKILITNFFSDFNWKKLNFPEQNKLEYIKKYVLELKLRSDPENYVYYHDVLYKVIVKQMGDNVDKTDPDNALIVKTEKKVGEYIREMISKYIKKHKIMKSKDKNILSTFNPLTSHLYFKMSYLYLKHFISYYKENAEILKQQEDQFSNDEDENEEEESESNIIIDEKSINSSARASENQRLRSTEREDENKNKKLMVSSIAGSSNHIMKSNVGISGIH